MLTTALIIRISAFYSIVCDEYAENGVKGTITSNINKCVMEALDEISFGTPIYKTEINDNNEVESIIIDSNRLNKTALLLSEKIYLCIEDNIRFGFPFGNVLGVKFLSGRGPKIHVTAVPIGFIEYDYRSELLSSGINQTLYRIKIDFKCNISVLAPFYEREISITTSVIIAEILIVGSVPNLLLPSVE